MAGSFNATLNIANAMTAKKAIISKANAGDVDAAAAAAAAVFIFYFGSVGVLFLLILFRPSLINEIIKILPDPNIHLFIYIHYAV
jgi:hypothetical protein